MQSQRPLYARECARVYTGMRALCVTSLLLFSPLSLFSSFLVLCDAYARIHMHAPVSLVLRSLVLLYLRVRCTTDAEKARIKLSRWFAVCIAWRCRVMRAGVRIYGRRCSRNADRWNVKVLAPFFARYARDKKFSVIFHSEGWVWLFVRRAKIGAHPKIRE